MHLSRHVALWVTVLMVAGGCRSPLPPPAAWPFPDDWFQDKSLVSAGYVSARWQRLEKLERALAGFNAPDFSVCWGENGGQTENYAGCVFRVSLATAEKMKDLHARLSAMGFRLRACEPRVLAYRVDPALKARAEQLVAAARQRIVARLPELVPGLRRHPGRESVDAYDYPESGFLCLAFDDLSTKMFAESRNCGTALALHLPSLGYLIQVFGAGTHGNPGGSGVAPYVAPEVLQLVRTELSAVMRLDPRAQLTGGGRGLALPAAAAAPPLPATAPPLPATAPPLPAAAAP